MFFIDSSEIFPPAPRFERRPGLAGLFQNSVGDPHVNPGIGLRLLGLEKDAKLAVAELLLL
jgi:hypothetical protein